MKILLGRSSEQPALCKTGELRTRHDDMVIHRNPENFPGLAELPRDGKVLLTRLRIAAWMIMDEDHAGSPFFQGFGKTLARMDKRRIERSTRDADLPHELVRRRQEQRPELLVAKIAQPGKIDTGHILGGMEQRTVDAVARREAASELKRCHDACRPGITDTELTQIGN